MAQFLPSSNWFLNQPSHFQENDERTPLKVPAIRECHKPEGKIKLSIESILGR
jgi:hypothetical protein